MTVAEIIGRYNSERDNRVSDDLKLRWIRALEKKVVVDTFWKFDGYKDSHTRHDDAFWVKNGLLHCPDWAYIDEDGNLIIDCKENISLINLSSFVFREDNGTLTYRELSDDEFKMSSELAIPEPFDDIYVYYLDMKTAYYNGDYARYNMALQEYNNMYLAYQQYYNRTHTVDRPRTKILRHEVI